MQTETLERVQKIIVEHLSVKPAEVTPEASIKDDLGADSLDVVDLVMELEDEFSLNIDEDEAEKIQTVGDIVKFVEEKAGNDA